MSADPAGSPAGGAPPPDGAPGGEPDPEPKEASTPKKGEKEATAFGDAVRNPLGDQARAAQQAYQTGRRTLRPPGLAAVIGEGRFQDFQVGDRFNVYTGRGLPFAPGRVRTELLEWVRVRYVPVGGYPRMVTALRERRLLVLQGPADSGRSTTALRLLDEVANGQVFRLPPAEDPTAIEGKDLTPQHGYLAELPAGRVPAETYLDRLCDRLTECRCFCVLLVEDSPSHREVLRGYTLQCPPPDQAALLTRHISREAQRDDEDGMEQRLLELSATPQLRRALGAAPQPVETVLFARLLVEHGRGKISLDDIEAGCLRSVDQQVLEWFQPLRELNRGDQADDQLRMAAFRIALAVLNESPYHLVREFGERLAREMMLTIAPRRTPGRTLFSDDRQTWLGASRAQVVDGDLTVGEASVPVELVRFQDDRFPLAVLTHVWRRHHNLRLPLVSWLRELGTDPRALVWVRAAQAAGLLCGLDFAYAFHELVAPGAAAEKVEQRRFAAFALDQAAQDDRVRPAIEELLQYWRRQGGPAEQWTAATALGCELGLRSPSSTLNELRIIGTRAEERQDAAEDWPDLVLVCGRSLATLFTRGARGPVLSCLDQWLRHERRSLRELALYTVLMLAAAYGSDLVEQRTLTEPAGRELDALIGKRQRWPLLLALRAQDDSLTEPFADMVWRALRSAANEVMADILGGWMHAGQRDPECLDAFIGFIPYLIDDISDVSRLLYLVKRMRRNWTESLDDETATRLEAAIDHALRQETAS